MDIKQALLQKNLPWIGATSWSSDSSGMDEDFLKVFAEGVSFARAAQSNSQILVALIPTKVTDEVSRLESFCNLLISSITAKEELLLCDIKKISSGIAKLTITAKLK